jgi:hypothetical protein
MNLEKVIETLLIAGGTALLIAGYLTNDRALKIVGILPLIFVLYVAYDIITRN